MKPEDTVIRGEVVIPAGTQRQRNKNYFKFEGGPKMDILT